MSLLIIGAGMAGLLAANLLRHHDPVVVEEQESLPHNHHAVLRFKTSLVGDALGIGFKRVTLVKHALPWRNPVADILAYSQKVVERSTTDRSTTRSTAEIGERWIAPRDLISQMASRVRIEYGRRYKFEEGLPKVISTVPMPSLAAAMDYAHPLHCRHRHGWVTSARVIDSEAYVSLLVPDPGIPFYRCSITGDHLTVETLQEPQADDDAELAADLLGVDIDTSTVTVDRQPYAKILPIDEGDRKQFIFWASSVMGRAYSLGRFATWRPSLQTQDLIQDIRLIEGWIREGAAHYSMELHEARRAKG